MSVEFWFGAQSQYRAEQDILANIYTYLSRQADHFWMLTNFHAGGNEVDLVVIKRTCIFVAEIKHIWSPISGGKNGPWSFEQWDGTRKDLRNPYQQVRHNTYDWKNFVWTQREKWLTRMHQAWLEQLFMPYSYVVISPKIHEDSRIQIHPDPVEVKGLDEFKSDLLLCKHAGLDLTREEVQRLLQLLNLAREDAEINTTKLLAEPVRRPGIRQLVPFGAEVDAGIFMLDKTKIKVGRGEDNDLVIRDERVSAKHAVISFEDGWWTVEDVGSTNGTWVRYNGESADERKIAKANALKDGSVVRFGPCYFRLMIIEPAKGDSE